MAMTDDDTIEKGPLASRAPPDWASSDLARQLRTPSPDTPHPQCYPCSPAAAQNRLRIGTFPFREADSG